MSRVVSMATSKASSKEMLEELSSYIRDKRARLDEIWNQIGLRRDQLHKEQV